MRKVRTTLMALAILVAITGIVSASENMLQNGGFETGSFSGWDTSLNLYATLPEWSTPEIVTSPVHNGTYAAYFECQDQQYYNWWPGSGHVDQARQTISNVDYSKLQNMVFDVWTKYTGGYSTWIHASSLGSVDFIVYDASNNPLSRYVIRHTSAPNYINYGAMQLSSVPGCFRTYTSGSGWTHSVVDIGSELVDSPTCGIPAEKQGEVDHVDVVIYTFSYGFGNGDAKIYVDDLVVYSTNEPPTAHIDSITPSPAVYGEEVSFTGHGTDPDGTVVAYNWRSSIDGVLNASSSFTTSTLSAGNHTSYFKVQDDKGDWSEEVSEELSVVCPTYSLQNVNIINNYDVYGIAVSELIENLPRFTYIWDTITSYFNTDVCIEKVDARAVTDIWPTIEYIWTMDKKSRYRISKRSKNLHKYT